MTSTSIKKSPYELVSDSNTSLFFFWSQLVISALAALAFALCMVYLLVESFSFPGLIILVVASVIAVLLFYVKYRFLFARKTIQLDIQNLHVLISEPKTPDQLTRVPYTKVTLIKKKAQHHYTLYYLNEVNQSVEVEFCSRDFSASRNRNILNFDPSFNLIVKHLDSEIRRAKKNKS